MEFMIYKIKEIRRNDKLKLRHIIKVWHSYGNPKEKY